MLKLLVAAGVALSLVGCTVNVDDGEAGSGAAAGTAGAAGDSGAGGGGGSGGTGGAAGANAEAIDDEVETIGTFMPGDEEEIELEPAQGMPIEDRCGAVSYWERTERFDRISVEDTHAPDLFPGNVVDGDDAVNSVLNRINAPLAPVTFSVSLQNTSNVSATLDTPSLSSFRTELNQLLSGAMTGSAPAQLTFSMAAVSSSEQLATSLGGSVSFAGLVELGGQLEFESTQYRSRFVVAFDQTYFTVDADPKNRPSDFFADEAAPTFASPPVYIRSIRYGRRILLLVKSESVEQSTRDALNVGFTNVIGGVSFGTSFDESQTTTFDSLEISAVVIGGNATSGVQAVTNLSQLQAMLAEGAEFSPTNPGAPIDFQFAYLADNAITEFSVTTQYVRHSCVDLYVSQWLLDAAGDGLGDPGEFYGPIEVLVTEDATEPCGVSRGAILGGQGSEWTGDAETYELIQVPSGADRPVCVVGHLYEEDVSDDDDYGALDLEYILPVPPMDTVGYQVQLTDGIDELAYVSEVRVVGASAATLD